MQSRDIQHETMRIYHALVDEREDWGGALVLCCGAGCAASGVSAAVSIAGGTTLAFDSDAAAMKSAMRAGYLDFVVNTLDEALRTLKNEIRQKRPLSVGLIADIEVALAEMVERGVRPDFQFLPKTQEGTIYRKRHHECFFAAPDSAALREIDAALLAALPAEDVVRRRWLERVPKYLREARSAGRWTWLSDEELELLAAQGLSPAPPSSAAPKAP
ncbi:MAG: hypothetical protein ABSG84_04665 [Acidobacteriaceae bacterium]|jgi:urocanate hydratase